MKNTYATIYVISDATAETAERVLRAALIQFDDVRPKLRVFSLVRQNEQIEDALRQAVDDQAFVVYTLVKQEQRDFLNQKAALYKVESFDLIGHLMSRLTDFLDSQPSGRPGHGGLDDDYFRRIEAVEFAVKHDDGQAVNGLADADIVLVGLSRTSKTPLSTYLAQRGLKVANVPIVLGLPLPHELEHVGEERIFGLTINPGALLRIRRARLKALQMPLDTDYARREHIVRELQYARDVFSAHPSWPVIDVSERAIEETAAILLQKRAARLREECSTESEEEKSKDSL